jgi:type IV pilus assembly protein PilA
MFKNMKKQLNNEKGLTLIELLAVIVILAIIAAIAVPAIGNIIGNSKDKAILADAANVLAGAKIARTDGACKTAADTGDTDGDNCTSVELTGYVENAKGTYSASYNPSTNIWTVNYSDLANIREDSKYETAATEAGTITENALITLMQE